MEARVRDATATYRQTSGRLVGAAVRTSKTWSPEGMRERAFTMAFSGLVYPQIWEDPVVDLEALELDHTSRMVAIASGGCNVMSYLTASPGHITALDLNTAHVALNKLKLCAVKNLPDYESFFRFFGSANDTENVQAFDTYLRPLLDADTHDFWNRKNLRGCRRIERFANNFYHSGLLGRFIGLGHALVRALGSDPKRLLAAKDQREQRRIYDSELAPLFQNRFVRWVINRPASLFGLGIPPAQYKALAGDHDDGIAGALNNRLERLACDFPLARNYFAWQAFGRRYEPEGKGSLPPYLERQNFETVCANAGRVDVRHASLVDFLKGSPDASLDRYVLLDAQDWMSDAVLTDLWGEITRTARPGARVIFRTAAKNSLLPGRVPEVILDMWRYEAGASQALTKKDRSAIYGGFHLYVLDEIGA